MSDLVIRGMEMPETCCNCKLKVGFSACGLVTDHKDGGFFYRVHEGKSRPDWCPLLPLPEGHGRLGDLDALMPDFVKARWEFFSDGDTFLRLLKNAPTIIPAEGGTDECSEN